MWFLVIFMSFLVIFNVIFGDFLVGEPPPYCDKILTKSQQIKFWSIFKKSWDMVRPPPLLGPNSQLLPNFFLRASLNGNCKTHLDKTIVAVFFQTRMGRGGCEWGLWKQIHLLSGLYIRYTCCLVYHSFLNLITHPPHPKLFYRTLVVKYIQPYEIDKPRH